MTFNEFFTRVLAILGAGVPIGGSTGSSTEAIRVPNVIKDVNAVAIGSIATVWTPAAGKKFRLMGGQFSVNQAGAIVRFDDNTTGSLVGGRTPYLEANIKYAFDWGNGVLSGAANRVLKATSSVTGSVMTGYLYGTEE